MELTLQWENQYNYTNIEECESILRYNFNVSQEVIDYFKSVTLGDNHKVNTITFVVEFLTLLKKLEEEHNPEEIEIITQIGYDVLGVLGIFINGRRVHRRHFFLKPPEGQIFKLRVETLFIILSLIVEEVEKYVGYKITMTYDPNISL